MFLHESDRASRFPLYSYDLGHFITTIHPYCALFRAIQMGFFPPSHFHKERLYFALSVCYILPYLCHFLSQQPGAAIHNCFKFRTQRYTQPNQSLNKLKHKKRQKAIAKFLSVIVYLSFRGVFVYFLEHCFFACKQFFIHFFSLKFNIFSFF